MRFLYNKTVALLLLLFLVLFLANGAAEGRIGFSISEGVITTLLAPIEYLTGKAGVATRHASTTIGDLWGTYEENQALKAERDKLRQEVLERSEVEAENIRLRSMLEYKRSAPQFDMVIAAIIARDPGTWTQSIIINKGSADGIAKDMPVVTAQGLVGNVVSVHNSTARIQLMLDPRSAVGAIVQRPESRVAAIVEGNGNDPFQPKMVNIPRDADIIKGDRIVTSGYGGIYPKGLLVGEVKDVVNNEGGLLKLAVIHPAVNFNQLEEVSVIIKSREPLPVLPGQEAKPLAQSVGGPS
ncbi:rod shape-determining protein MreC [Azotosporobacter soli]|uniref:rod shape-determining protein MreC n=1 Tax=Azotosporobacter soli TaxID=3055040 RepID=UPI0031FF3412